MLSEHIILQSAGSLSVAVLALLMLILQTLFFFRKPQFTWYAWSAAISFSALLYSVGIFLEYNTPQGPLNRSSGLLEWTAIICLIQCLYGFTFSYLGIESKRYHPVAGVCHGLVLILLWSTNYLVADSFTTRNFIGLESPYIEPALGPLGPVFELYAAIAGVNAMIVWMKHKRIDPKHRITFLAGMGFWILLGIHDGLASLGVPTLQYVMEYGFLGFAMAVLWVVFNSYLEITKASLREKELLLREVHHRVKNNMQIISSLLNLQSRYIKDKEALEMFKESQDRIRAMSLIHEKLYRSDDLARIKFSDYVRDLTRHIFSTYRAASPRVGLHTDIGDTLLDITTAIPCGLIINELVTNSLRHAFPGGRKGKITITLHSAQGTEIELTVSDDGIGMPEAIDIRKTQSLGLQLVTILAEDQLQGQINLERAKGTTFQITWRAPQWQRQP